jgi:hypothetical protein
MRGLLHSIDAIFYDSIDTPRRAVISQSKIHKGDATWSTVKTILGWVINTANMTLKLPHHRQERLLQLISEALPRRRISRKNWQRLLGELRSMALAITGAKYNFSLLQNALVTQTGKRIRVTALLRQALRDWNDLILQLATPMPITTLVPQPPNVIMGCDASILGAGGWLWLPSQPHHMYLWRQPFPLALQRQVVSAENPHGTINNSELELTGILLSAHLAAALSKHPHPTLWCAADNIAAVAWANNGSNSSNSPSAFLLRLLGQLSQRRQFSLTAFNLAGDTNIIADNLSHRFHLPWTTLAPSLLPTQTSWTVAHLPSDALLQVISALSKQTCATGYQLEIPQLSQPLGPFGNDSVPTSVRIPISANPTTQYPYYNSLRDATELAPWLPAAVQCQLKRWHEPFVPWGRRWPHWDNLTHGSLKRVPSIYGLPGNWQPMGKRTHLQDATNLSRSPSCAGLWNIASWPTQTKPRQ